MLQFLSFEKPLLRCIGLHSEAVDGPFLTPIRLKIVSDRATSFRGIYMTEKRTAAKRASALIGRTTAKTTAQKAPPKSMRADEPVARSVSDEEIALRAYALWEERGRPYGSPEEDWHNAITQLRGEDKTSGSSDLGSTV
jgi:hypothetical protein